jgi:hypothetical protein
MRGLSERLNRGVIAGLAIVGVSGIGGLTAGFTTRAGLGLDATTVVAATIARMAPSDIVNLRFPAEWAEAAEVADAASADATPQRLVLASADGSFNLFSPQPIYPIAPVYPSAEAAAPIPTPTPAAKPKAAAAGGMVLASLSSKPAVVAPKPVVQRSSAVLNDSQIASIKRRLNLTPDQERYWPAVEAELRKMEYKKDKAQGSRLAAIDISKVDVEGLKSAGFPLVMSFSDDQRRELKSLAHLLGLENVMSGI